MVRIVYEMDRDRVAAYDGEILAGECTYSKSGQVWEADHTKVDENYGGQGIASRLVAELVEQARKNGAKIVPVCSLWRKSF